MSIRLPLTDDERLALRRAGLRIGDVRSVGLEALVARTGWSLVRAKELVAHAEFQSLPSIGPAASGDLVKLGYRTVAQLRGQDAVRMRQRLEQVTGLAQDPCVEDVFACAVYAAEHGIDGTPPWWDFSRQRLARNGGAVVSGLTTAGRRPPGPRTSRRRPLSVDR